MTVEWIILLNSLTYILIFHDVLIFLYFNPKIKQIEYKQIGYIIMKLICLLSFVFALFMLVACYEDEDSSTPEVPADKPAAEVPAESANIE